jgi:hypothetical protein
MKISLNFVHRACRSVLLCCALAILMTSAMHAKRLDAVAVDQSVEVTDNLALVKFSIKVTNDEESAMTNLFVIFSDDTSVAIGDVPGGKTVVSAPQSRTIDLSDHPSRNIPIKVKLKFDVDGEPQEVPGVLLVTRDPDSGSSF